METIFAEGAIRPQQAVGKPLVIFKDGEKKQIGVVTHAAVKDGKLYFAATIDLESEEA